MSNDIYYPYLKVNKSNEQKITVVLKIDGAIAVPNPLKSSVN